LRLLGQSSGGSGGAAATAEEEAAVSGNAQDPGVRHFGFQLLKDAVRMGWAEWDGVWREEAKVAMVRDLLLGEALPR